MRVHCLQRRPDIVRFELSDFWRGTPASQHKPVFPFDLTGSTLIDTAGKTTLTAARELLYSIWRRHIGL